MQNLKWWQKAVFYQIYPRSFADGNGDGIGDLSGMIAKLDYLQDLGIDAIWLSPHYPSPQFDCGYDISDYTDVEPEYGTLDEFKLFLDKAHERGIRIILDMVLNHTSHLHRWFQESRSSREHPKRDWFIWRDGKHGGPPNNWNSTFGGSAWELDPQTGQYYYHCFLKEQPDLNWRNPEVKQAMFEAVRFWLQLGVDGYRLDAIATIFEHPDLPDQPVNYSMVELGKMYEDARTDEDHKKLGELWEEMFKFQTNQPGIHALMQELRTVIDEFPDRMLIAEDGDIAFMGNGCNEMHLVFNFPLMQNRAMRPGVVRRNQKQRLAKLAKAHAEAWPCNTLGNHDSGRVYTRWGDGKHNDALARVNLALMLTLKGTPFLYNGEEIGMSDLVLDDIQQFKDLSGIWMYQAAMQGGLSPEKALKMAAESTRDKNRTPMQWKNAPNAGFSPQGVQTWLPVNPNYAEGINVAEQENDPGSLLSFYKRLLRLRRQTPALVEGDYQVVNPFARNSLAFMRLGKSQKVLVVLNYSDKKLTLDLRQAGKPAKVLFSEEKKIGQMVNLEKLTVEPYEVLIAETG